MKRLFSAILALALTFALCACGSGSGSAQGWQEKYDLGKKYLGEGNYQEAVVAFKAAITIDPKRAEAYSGAADAYIGQKDYDGAREILQEGYKATGDESLKTKLDGLLDSDTAAGAKISETVFATVTVIYNPDVYADSWKAYVDQYQKDDDSQRCSIDSYGVRFSSPVTFTIDGKTYTATEACLINSDAFPTGGLHDYDKNTNSELVGKALTVTGYFMLNEQTTEMQGPTARDGVTYYNYRPNGPYQFEISSYK